MKTTVAPFDTAAWCVRIECTNGTTVRLTTYPHDLTMSNATVYKADGAYEETSYQATNSMAPSALDLEGLVGVSGITRAAIAAGIFDGARIKIFRCDFLSPQEDYEEVAAGFFGKTTLVDDRYTAEMMSLVDTLNQSTGLTTTPGCRHTFCSQGFAECGLDIADFTVTGTLTGVTSGSAFTDSARSEAADYFGAGTIRFTSGANAGLKPLEIRSHATGGVITTHEPFYYVPAVGDAYEMTAGCRKTRDACKAKGNILNFGGFPDLPLNSAYSKIGTKF
jgi:uncharacterized phage protein (TIGR02218 family)